MTLLTCYVLHWADRMPQQLQRARYVAAFARTPMCLLRKRNSARHTLECSLRRGADPKEARASL